jgi:hypothetical protein
MSSLSSKKTKGFCQGSSKSEAYQKTYGFLKETLCFLKTKQSASSQMPCLALLAPLQKSTIFVA